MNYNQVIEGLRSTIETALTGRSDVKLFIVGNVADRGQAAYFFFNSLDYSVGIMTLQAAIIVVLPYKKYQDALTELQLFTDAILNTYDNLAAMDVSVADTNNQSGTVFTIMVSLQENFCG